MRKITFIIFIILFGCNSNLKYLNKFGGYKGKPKKVEETSYRIDYKDSTLKETYTGKNIILYDSEGRKIKAMLFKSDNSLSVEIGYSYNQQGNLIESIMYNIDSTINSKNKYKYNTYGQQIENIYIRGSSNIKSITKSNFDRRNKMEEITGKNGDGTFKEYAVQKYDDKWNVIELISFDSIGKQETRIEFDYDENNNKNSSRWYNAKDELYNFTKTTFNKQNHPIIDFSFNIEKRDTIHKQVTRFEYKYHENNNIKERKFIYNDKSAYILRYKYY